MKTYVYARQSIDLAEGIDRQIVRCRKLCEAREWDVAAEFVDNATSATKRRGGGTAWADLLEVMERGDVVVAVDVDRLLRSLEDLVDIQKLGVRVLTVDGEIDTTTADGEFRASMLASIARFETRRKSERQVRANQSLRTKGKPVPGKRRFGFEQDNVTVRADEAAVVRRMFEDVSTGTSLRSLAAALVAEGVEATTGKGWTTRRLRSMLMNPHYVGRIAHTVKDPKTGQSTVTVYESDVVPALVEVDTWDRVQAALNAEGRGSRSGPKPQSLLSGILRCAECDRPMRKRRTAYVCPAEHNNAQVAVNDELVRQIAAMVATSYRLPFDDESNATAGRIATLTAELERIDAEQVAVSQDRRDGLMTPSVARQRLVDLAAERAPIEADIAAAIAVQGDLLTWTESVRGIVDAGGSVDDAAAEFDRLDLDGQRAVVVGVAEYRVKRAERRGRAVPDEWRLEFRERGAEHWSRARLVDGRLEWNGWLPLEVE